MGFDGGDVIRSLGQSREELVCPMPLSQGPVTENDRRLPIADSRRSMVKNQEFRVERQNEEVGEYVGLCRTTRKRKGVNVPR